MTRKQSLKSTLLAAFIALTLGGFLLHFRIHNPAQVGYGYLPFLIGLFGLFGLPLMFWFSQTIAYAFVINTMLVIIGIVTMTHFSIAHFDYPLTLFNIIFNTLLGDILILASNLVIGKAIFDLELLKTGAETMPRVTFWRFWRYPNWGWIVVHFFTIGIVYALGHLLWR